MGGLKKSRPFLKLLVGFCQDNALTPNQLYAYVALADLGIRRFAQTKDDSFLCRGSDLTNALGCGGTANAVRRCETLPSDLASVRKHPERKGVWIVKLPGFTEIQGFRPPAGKAGSSSATRRSDPGRMAAQARLGSGSALGGGADEAKGYAATGHEALSPSLAPTPTPSPSPGRKRQLQGGQGNASLPKELPTEIRDRVRSIRHLFPENIRCRIDDDDYLTDEYRLLRQWHEEKGTVVYSVEMLFQVWLWNSNTGERAHERLKAAREKTAESESVTRLIEEVRLES